MEARTSELLQELFEKYRLSGQNTNDYLEGLLVSNYEPYWKYIHLDSLLSLQNPKTDFKDEFVFIAYHQITELYFRLTLHELEQVTENPTDTRKYLECLQRMNRYLRHLISSFDIMTDGMRQEEFLKFRMALLPASGFQSGQFRMIEFCCTDLINLVPVEDRQRIDPDNIEQVYQHVYWKRGAIDLETGEKTLTLKQFEGYYDPIFMKRVVECTDLNLWAIYSRLKEAGKITEEITNELKRLDVNMNVNWKLSHYRAAVRYLARQGGDVSATGGTNWQKFLPPRFQRIMMFPALWEDGDKEEWGKSWVMEQLNNLPEGLRK